MIIHANAIGQLTGVSISGERVARYLTELYQTRRKSQCILCDNGTEFTSKTIFFCSKRSKVKLTFIQPGKPTQNAFVESFNSKFRAAYLNQHWFRDLAEAREEFNEWRRH